MRKILNIVLIGSLGLAAFGCGSNDSSSESSPTEAAQTAETSPTSKNDEKPRVVVTTSIWGDVAESAFGSLADIEVIMPAGADPHDFAPSARQAEAMENADLLVVNGAGLEEGMQSVIDAAADSGVTVFAFADHVDLIEFGADGEHEDDHETHDHYEHDEHDHDHEEDSDDEPTGHDHGPNDPHIWLDPLLVAESVDHLGHALVDIGVDHDAIHAAADPYIEELEALDNELAQSLSVISAEHRVLITNHDSFGYFAAHYDFEVVGTIIDSVTTNAETSSAHLEELARTIDEHGVTAIFTESIESGQLANTLAEATGDKVEVVELLTGSLAEGDAGTYVGYMRTNIQRIVDALG